MSTAPQRRIAAQEYLALERQAEFKSEFYCGEMFAKSGASDEHLAIAGNIYALIWNQIRGRRCRVYTSDMRVKVQANGLYTYPDVAALCGQPQFDDQHLDTLLNPQVIVEVLSPSTAGYDRGEKFELYRAIDTLKEYLVVAQDRVRLEHYVRQDNDSWLVTDYVGLDSEISLPSIDCRLRLVEVYENVNFDDELDRD